MNNTTTLVPYDVLHFSEIEERPECPICLDTDKRLTFCVRDYFVAHSSEGDAHYFHRTCLANWLNNPYISTERKCPLCRMTFSQLSVKQELAIPLPIKGARHANRIARTVLRGAYWGAWSWSLTQLIDPRMLCSKVFLDVTCKAAAFSCGQVLITKGVSLLRLDRPNNFCLGMVLSGVVGSFLLDYEIQPPLFPLPGGELFARATACLLCFLAPSGYSPLSIQLENVQPHPREERINSFIYTFSRNLYRWSKKAIPLLIGSVAAGLITLHK